MKTMKLLRYAALTVLASVFFISSQAMAAKTVVILCGVSEEAAGPTRTETVIEGINEILKPEGIEPTVIYGSLDLLPKADVPAAADKYIAMARAKKPDLIITLNDIMAVEVIKKVDDIPVVFGWIFYPPQFLGLPKANVTGVTRMSYAADNWILAKQLLGAKTVGLMSKENPSMIGVKNYLAAGADKLEAATGVRYKDMIMVKTFDEWKKAVKEFSYDFMYLADTSQVLENGKIVSRTDVTAWTIENSKVPVIAATEIDVDAGALLTVVTAEKTIGKKAAECVVKILKGAAPADVPYVTSAKGRLVINMKTANKYKLEIPYDLLASADRVIE